MEVKIKPEYQKFLDQAAEWEAEAELIEGFAKDNYENAARRYGGGSFAFVNAIAEADRYTEEAKILRQGAADHRAGIAKWIKEDQENGE
ncbi:hypothetical protein [Gordonia neofelifaecis]|uniref:Uncharacterized protein n=1 Tax=Gordonia neofelifaecis NRRL B-59395 TaxID=644548 RepID=F1YE72_9ACTN|nr:hypothetical protein [Gordonia neofelifaecis]EGD57162.1 hypothetical protein SCNU_02270 [Gordonia neofelifaecis NRRL B-59395]